VKRCVRELGFARLEVEAHQQAGGLALRHATTPGSLEWKGVTERQRVQPRSIRLLPLSEVVAGAQCCVKPTLSVAREPTLVTTQPILRHDHVVGAE
jgi:hypothetical protein